MITLIRYEGQLEELKKKGYFMMADGVKSTEYTNATTKKKVKSTDATPRQPVKIRASGNLAGK